MEYADKVLKSKYIRKIAETKQIQLVAEKTKLQAEHVAVGVIFLGVLFVAFTSLGRAIVFSALFFFYPTYKSFLAVDSNNNLEIRKWLTYWVAFGSIYILSDIVTLLFGWITGLGLIQILFLTYILHPATNGDEVLYTKAIRPLLIKYNEQIDRFVDKSGKAFQNAWDNGKQYAGEKVAENLLKKNN